MGSVAGRLAALTGSNMEIKRSAEADLTLYQSKGKFLISAGAFQMNADSNAGWIGCWFIFDSASDAPTYPLMKGACREPLGSCSKAMQAAHREAVEYLGESLGMD